MNFNLPRKPEVTKIASPKDLHRIESLRLFTVSMLCKKSTLEFWGLTLKPSTRSVFKESERYKFSHLCTGYFKKIYQILKLIFFMKTRKNNETKSKYSQNIKVLFIF